MRPLLLAVVSLGIGPSAGAAQSRPFGPAPSALFVAASKTAIGTTFSAERGDTGRLEIRPTYWKKGAAIGGVVGALSGLLFSYTLCGLSEEPGDNCGGTMLRGVVGGGLLLAIPGALIGGQFTKPEE